LMTRVFLSNIDPAPFTGAGPYQTAGLPVKLRPTFPSCKSFHGP
jgi:hypothetical protein